MKARRFTDSFLQRLEPTGQAYRVRDRSEAVGFGIQVAAGGTRTFFLAYSVRGRKRYVGLHRYRPPVTEDGKRVASNLADQRALARKLRALHDEGTDPARWLVEQVDARRTGSLLRLLAYHLRTLGTRPSAKHARAIYRRDVVPHIDARRPAREITADDLTPLLAKIQRRGAPVQAERARSFLRTAFERGAKQDHDPRSKARGLRFALASNPVALIPSYQREEAARDRVLSADELAAFWHALGDHDLMRPSTGLFLRLCLLTGQRPTQWRLATRSELDDAGVWLFPPSSMKSRNPVLARAHALPLPPVALDVVREQMAHHDSALLFPSTRDPGQPMDLATPNAAIQRYCRRTGAAPFTARDLRRTWKTRAADAGLTTEQRDRVQAHGVTKDAASEHYDWNLHLDTKRTGLERWAAWLDALVAGEAEAEAA